MKKAIFADVHSNLPAFRAVIEDIKEQNPDEVLFLGDIVGYGPYPIECLELLSGFAHFLGKGNHDHATATGDYKGFNYKAADAVDWTITQLKKHLEEGGKDYFAFLQDLNEGGHEDGRCLFVHGSHNDPLNEYVLRSWYNTKSTHYKAAVTAMEEGKRWLFAAHAHDTWVHYPGLEFDLGNGEKTELWDPVGSDSIILPEDKPAVIMIGSVGQPRDRDPQACYVILEDNVVHFRRVPYDIDAVAEKIKEIPFLHNSLADRLYLGK